MSKQPSEKTQLASAKRELKSLTSELKHWQSIARYARARATQAEQACEEWKQRFDKLLEFRKLTESP